MRKSDNRIIVCGWIIVAVLLWGLAGCTYHITNNSWMVNYGGMQSKTTEVAASHDPQTNAEGELSIPLISQ